MPCPNCSHTPTNRATALRNVATLVGESAQEQLELGEDLLDRIDVGAVGRQEQQLCSCRSDRLAHGLAFVAAQIVHDDDVTGREGRDEDCST